MWDLIARLVNTSGRVVNSSVAGRMALGAVFGGLLGAFPIALLFMHGEHLFGSALVGAGVGAVMGFFYHRGYADAVKRERLDLEWRINQDDFRKQKDD